MREKGIASADKKADRDAADGTIGIYVHTDGKQAAMVEVNYETDFVARTEDFQQLCRDLAMQVVAMKPLYVRREEVPAKLLKAERKSTKRKLPKKASRKRFKPRSPKAA